jgi:hypothetical protein
MLLLICSLTAVLAIAPVLRQQSPDILPYFNQDSLQHPRRPAHQFRPMNIATPPIRFPPQIPPQRQQPIRHQPPIKPPSKISRNRPLWIIGEDHLALKGYDRAADWHTDILSLRRQSYAELISLLRPLQPIIFEEIPMTHPGTFNRHTFGDERVWEVAADNSQLMQFNALLLLQKALVEDHSGHVSDWRWLVSSAAAGTQSSVLQELMRDISDIRFNDESLLRQLQDPDNILRKVALLVEHASDSVLNTSAIADNEFIPNKAKEEFHSLLTKFKNQLGSFDFGAEYLNWIHVMIGETLLMRDYNFAKVIADTHKMLIKKPNRPFVLIVGRMHSVKIYEILEQAKIANLDVGAVVGSWDDQKVKSKYLDDMEKYTGPMRRMMGDDYPLTVNVKPSGVTSRGKYDDDLFPIRKSFLE